MTCMKENLHRHGAAELLPPSVFSCSSLFCGHRKRSGSHSFAPPTGVPIEGTPTTQLKIVKEGKIRLMIRRVDESATYQY